MDTSYSKASLSKKRKQLSNSREKSSKKVSKMTIECDEHTDEIKTPPLPSSSSLNQLLKKRNSLKDELNKIYGNHATSNSNNLNHKAIKKSLSLGNKRSLKIDGDTNMTKKSRKSLEGIQYSEESYLDSEEEENIIKERRKQRKQLLDKLEYSIKGKLDKDQESKDEKVNTVQVENTQNDKDMKDSKHTENVETSETKLETPKETSDMFSEKEFMSEKSHSQDGSIVQLSDDCDDTEGYYKIVIGDMVNKNQYTIKSILGQGVFANVVLAQDNKNKSDVAIKIMRNKDIIHFTGMKELAVLKQIKEADPENKHHCVKLLGDFMHKGHLCVVIEPLFMNMRKVIRKYGRNGLNMKAVISYSRQLLTALRLLKKIGIIHADIKPDNILVNEKKNVLKLCDFGSASKVGENEITPYLVSRFYRAPEIILGIPYKYSIDIWSAACTIYEMATGKIMFTGSSNNKMLKCFMDLKGKVPSRLLRKGKFKNQHFNYNNSFLLHKKDEISGREKYVEMSSINATRELLPELKKIHINCSIEIENKLLQLKDLLEKMLILDSSHRLSVSDCLRHPFIQETLTKL